MEQKQNLKPGYLCTEFWLTLIAVVAAALLSAGVFAEGSAWARTLASLVGVMAALGYTHKRVEMKQAQNGGSKAPEGSQ